ncbi:hypothetical protein D9615_008015 [Tricholomella constricta]|uniref:DUF5648 domain-containing protein n=1 Tax=Tricholomella constricta TaxID=117010 RepID=A0A8H5H2J1_9AGAR|nr:hypothetical protein D9615_008015 [Tricholomella constricta]
MPTMKFSLIIASVLVYTVSAASTEYGLEARAPTNEECGETKQPLFRLYKRSENDHFYTNSQRTFDRYVYDMGWTDEGIAGYLLKSHTDLTTPFFRLYHAKKTDHLYTTSEKERDTAISSSGYVSEGEVGEIYVKQSCGAVPLYRLFNEKTWDHFYTTDPEERDGASGYKSEGIAGYILPRFGKDGKKKKKKS